MNFQILAFSDKNPFPDMLDPEKLPTATPIPTRPFTPMPTIEQKPSNLPSFLTPKSAKQTNIFLILSLLFLSLAAITLFYTLIKKRQS